MSQVRQYPAPSECNHPAEEREVVVHRTQSGETSAVDFCNRCAGYV